LFWAFGESFDLLIFISVTVRATLLYVNQLGWRG
jgi:hypothetical protein